MAIGKTRWTILAAILSVTALGCEEPASLAQQILLRITPRESALAAIGDTVNLTVQASQGGNPVTVSATELSFSSLDTSVVGVNTAGVVTAKAAGTGRIVARALGVSDTATITVRQTAARVRLSRSGSSSGSLLRSSASMADSLFAIGDTIRFVAVVQDRNGHPIPGATIAWSASNPLIASVTDGLVRSLLVGQTAIIASAAGISDSVVVVVTQVASRVQVSNSASMMNAIGDTVRVTLGVFDRNGVDILNVVPTWASANEARATVDAQGRVIGRQVGSVVIRGGYLNLSDSTTIHIRQIPAAAQITPATLSIYVGGTGTLTAAAVDSNGVAIPGLPFGWSSSNPLIATVDGGNRDPRDPVRVGHRDGAGGWSAPTTAAAPTPASATTATTAAHNAGGDGHGQPRIPERVRWWLGAIQRSSARC
jgi:uncharacterized protein YjdB